MLFGKICSIYRRFRRRLMNFPVWSKGYNFTEVYILFIKNWLGWAFSFKIKIHKVKKARSSGLRFQHDFTQAAEDFLFAA